MYETNCPNVNSCDTIPAPDMTLRDKVQILHKQISNASDLASGISEFLFGIEPTTQDNSLERSAACMDDKLENMIDQMKKILGRLSEIRDRLGAETRHNGIQDRGDC